MSGWAMPLPALRVKLSRALLLSLLLHALLLSLTFGEGAGLPGLAFPWEARRTEAPDLRVVLQGAVPVMQPPRAEPMADIVRDTAATGDASPEPDALAPPVGVRTLSTEEALGELAPPAFAAPARLAVERSDVAAWAVNAASAVPTSAIGALVAASSPAVEAMKRADDGLRSRRDSEARERTAAIDGALLDAKPLPTTVVSVFAGSSSASSPAVESLRRAGEALKPSGDRPAVDRRSELAQLDGVRQAASQQVQQLEAARQAADQVAAAQQEAARQQAAKAEAARLEALRQEAARAEAAQRDAARQESARQEVAQAEAARQQAERQEAIRQQASRVEAARQETARLDAAKLATANAQAQAEEEQRESRKRAIGRQLDEEAAKRDAERQRPDWKPARRGRLFGRIDANAELVLYAETWARKIQNNQTVEMVGDAARQPHAEPIVTVAVRSDGSVETITFVRSSGVPALDEAVRRVIQSQERYAAFPPALLRDYDVVEIRRTWQIDTAIRLY